MKRFNVSLWNIQDVPNRDLCGRTNNPIERYNRRLNERLSAHPNLLSFISVIREEDNYFSLYCSEIRRGTTPLSVLVRNFTRPEIDPKFKTFVRKQKKR